MRWNSMLSGGQAAPSCRLKLFCFGSFCSIFTCDNTHLCLFEEQHCFLRPSVTLSNYGIGLQDVFVSGLWRAFVHSWLLCVFVHIYFYVLWIFVLDKIWFIHQLVMTQQDKGYSKRFTVMFSIPSITSVRQESSL